MEQQNSNTNLDADANTTEINIDTSNNSAIPPPPPLRRYNAPQNPNIIMNGLIHDMNLLLNTISQYPTTQLPFFPPPPPPPSDLANTIQQSFTEDEPQYIKIISEKGLASLEDISFNKEIHTEQTACPITTDDFEDGEIITKLPCGHLFGKDAIHKWLTESNHKCPICRYELDSKEVRKSEQPMQVQNTDEANISSAPVPPPIISPVSTLLNRPVIPHSYISTLMRQRMQEQIDMEEEAMLQEAIMASLGEENQEQNQNQ
jgi:hypothetical protein